MITVSKMKNCNGSGWLEDGLAADDLGDGTESSVGVVVGSSVVVCTVK